jgi:glycosyltransferase involved in cell wall biosynthesis
MKITFVLPRIDRSNFTGGLYCALRHANELAYRGHDVSVVAYPKSVTPEWIDLKAKLIVPSKIKWPKGLSFSQALLERRLLTIGNCGQVHLATNGTDPEIFTSGSNALPRIKDTSPTLHIISYGGRDARWKGFSEMAEAVRAARESLPNMTIEWNVYGPALLPADNHIAPYNHLGFLSQTELASAYRMNDVLLSASWYESFPLFPIEAMACGLAVITTAFGTEDYAVDGKNCLVVEPRNVDSITGAIVRLALDRELLNQIASSAQQVVDQHNWQVAGSRMEDVLQQIVAAPTYSAP